MLFLWILSLFVGEAAPHCVQTQHLRAARPNLSGPVEILDTDGGRFRIHYTLEGADKAGGGVDEAGVPHMARRVARQVESGAVCINDVVISYGLPELPFGGVKTSGVGRRHSLAGIRKYAIQQSIAEDRLGFPKDPHWYPYSAKLLPLLEKAAGLFAGLTGFIRRG